MLPRTLLALGALALAGCLSAPSSPLDPGSVPVARPVIPWEAALHLDHDHFDPALHRVATPNVRLLGQVPPAQLGVYPLNGAQGELDIRGTLAFAASLLSGFTVLDVSEPSAPRVLSITPVAPGAYVADIKASQDGRYAFLGIQLGFPGIQVYDVQDPARPLLVAHAPYKASGCHMLAYKVIAGQEYLFCSSGEIGIWRFERTPVPHIVYVASYAPGGVPVPFTGAGILRQGDGSHDMTVQDDPLTGQPVMLASFWGQGVWMVDVSDPAQPRDLGSWAGEGATYWDGKVHTTMATAIGGKRVVVSVPEYASTPAVFVLDATDPSRMRLLAEWVPREDANYGGEAVRFSTHNFQLVGDRAYLAMYHGGVWVLDLRDAASPKPLAVFLPSEAASPDVPVPGVTVENFQAPSTWDVVVADGRIFALDTYTGLYVLEFEGDPAGDEAYDSFA